MSTDFIATVSEKISELQGGEIVSIDTGKSELELFVKRRLETLETAPEWIQSFYDPDPHVAWVLQDDCNNAYVLIGQKDEPTTWPELRRETTPQRWEAVDDIMVLEEPPAIHAERVSADLFSQITDTGR